MRAYRVADATAIAPFGYLIFTEVPSGWTLAGAAIIGFSPTDPVLQGGEG